MKRRGEGANGASVHKKRRIRNRTGTESSDEEDRETIREISETARRRGREDEAGDDAPYKRLRNFVRGEDDYCPGNIINVELKNFMTYDYIQTTPGPRLNLVIGPNGTGKSSLVCAICIGLAGEPKLLGRAGNIGDYVQRGHEEGSIKIILRGETPVEKVEILRKINTSNKSEWFLNGAPCKKETVKDLTKKLNIQVGNLTQFLPQDRVCEFAKLSAIDLLKETQKAVGDPELYDHHLYLIEKKGQLLQLDTTVNQKKERLGSLKAENAELEKDVERINERDQMLKKAELMRMKVPWLKYDMIRRDFALAKEEGKKAKQELHEVARRREEAKAPLVEAKSKLEALAKQVNQLGNDLVRKDKQRINLVIEEEGLVNQVQGKEIEIDQKHREAEQQEVKLEKAKSEYRQAQAEHDNFHLPEPPTEQRKKISKEIAELREKAFQLEREERVKNQAITQKARELESCRLKLNEAESWKGKIVQSLFRAGERNIQESLSWLHENKHLMKGQVYGPIATEVQIADPLHAKYVEQHVPFWVWKAFITTNKEDRDLLVRKIRVDVINCLEPDLVRSGQELTDQARALGVTHRLDQVFNALPIVKNVLCAQAALHKSFIGTQEAENNATIISNMGIRDLWTPQHHFRWSGSSYHSGLTCLSHSVRPCRIFSTGIGEDEIAHLQRTGAQIDHEKRRLEQELEELRQHITQCEEDSNVLEKEKDAIELEHSLQVKQKKELKNKVETCRRVLGSIQKMQDPKVAQERLRQEISSLNQERLKKALQIHKLLIEVGRGQMRLAPLLLAKVEVDAQERGLVHRCTEHDGEVRLAEERVAALDRKIVQLREATRRAMEAGKRVIDLTNHPEVQEAFNLLPNTVEELDASVDQIVSDANAILCPNPHVVDDYERRQKQIKEIEEELETIVADLDKLSAEVESVKGKWLPRLHELVAKINETFGRNFADMAVAGEVSLDEHGVDFDKYGILIKVKFREAGELQVLSAHHQSGGERSVSTILYLVSLQAITQCPFRVVDEINQGMDPNNERKMFQQLVRAASQPNTPQSFLLTPKLLSDLDYGTSCSVLNIMNGPYIAEVAHGAFKRGASFASALQSLVAMAEA